MRNAQHEGSPTPPNMKKGPLPVFPPEALREENDYCEELEPSRDHQAAEVELQDRVESGEGSSAGAAAGRGSDVGNQGEGSGKAFLHAKALQRKDEGRHQEDARVYQKESCDIGYDRSGDRVGIELYGNDRSRVKSPYAVAGDQLEHYQDPDDFDGSGGGGGTASRQGQTQQNELA